MWKKIYEFWEKQAIDFGYKITYFGELANLAHNCIVWKELIDQFDFNNLDPDIYLTLLTH